MKKQERKDKNRILNNKNKSSPLNINHNKDDKNNNKKKYSIWDKFTKILFLETYECFTSQQEREQEETKQQNKVVKIVNKQYIFNSIIGYDEIKKVMQSMLDSHSVSILLSGSAGCGKSMFLKEIERFYPDSSYYIDGSRASKAGIFDVLFNDTENRIRYLLIDELDKLNISDQEALLTLCEDGKIIQTLRTESREKKYHNISLICASNHLEDILYPLQTRLFVILIDYTEQQFKEITKKVLPEKYDTSIELSDYVASEVWRLSLKSNKKPDIRDCIKIVKLSKNDPKIIDMLLQICY